MVFALLYGLGLRVGEAVRLRRHDIDFDRQLLFVRETKFDKSRFVPFGPRLGERLYQYLETRKRRLGLLQPDHAVFSFAKDRRQPIYTNTISWTFRKLVLDLDFKVPAGVAPPHLHCLRHSFAVGVLLRWYRAGIDPSDRLLHLSTFLGHVSPASTAVYLTITNELLWTAHERFERFAAPTLGEVKP
jgi:integrase